MICTIVCINMYIYCIICTIQERKNRFKQKSPPKRGGGGGDPPQKQGSSFHTNPPPPSSKKKFPPKRGGGASAPAKSRYQSSSITAPCIADETSFEYLLR